MKSLNGKQLKSAAMLTPDPAPTTLLTDMFEALTPDQQDLFRNRLRAATAPPKTIEELLDMYHRGSIPVNRVYEILNGTHS